MIEAQGLKKRFRRRGGDVVAVAGVDISVAAGEIVGFLGPNGAGKTTTLRMLTTLVAATAGEARVAGHDLRREPAAVRRRIGYVAQGGMSSPEARAAEELVDQARLYGIARVDAERRADTLLCQLELDGVSGRAGKTLSGGQRRRLDIALGLVHAPPLLFLDEPTTGLDPQARANLWTHIRALREDGVTVFLTTHYLEEADALCDRILIIDDGRIIAGGAPEALKRTLAGDTIKLAFSSGADALRAAAVLGAGVADRPLVEGHRLRLDVPQAHAALPDLLSRLAGVGIAVSALEVRRATLDDVFFSLTGRALREDIAA